MPVAADTYRRIFAVVKRVPRGRVATYGQVAALARLPRHARLVGYALHTLPPGSDVPWHRVVNAQGKISWRPSGGCILQRKLLRSEGVRFSRAGRIDFDEFAWRAL